MIETKKNFQPVKDYALLKGITVQAVYDKIKKEQVLVKKIGTYTLVCEK